jgi:CheY-like chemotaxis protein
MAEGPIAQLEPAEADSRNCRTILIIDDDKSQVAALDYCLQKQGFRVLTAFSGHRAMQLANEAEPDLILLDLRLPDVQGFDVCAKLADAPDTCGIPIIILSGMEGPDIVRRARAVGCEYFVRKPYDPNVLLTLIEQALQRERC